MLEVSAKKYFKQLKKNKKNITCEELKETYSQLMNLFAMYISTGQVNGASKILFQLKNIDKEILAINKGINQYLLKDDITEYIENVKDRRVKIIELERFERIIPDDIVAKIKDTKNIFSQFYVVFTDYTDKEAQRAIKEKEEYKIEKDPILFGTFKGEDNKELSERFYFIGDWEDEYCDLTLDKMLIDIKKISNKTPLKTIEMENNKNTLLKLEQQLFDLREVSSKKKKKNFLNKIKETLKIWTI